MKKVLFTLSIALLSMSLYAQPHFGNERGSLSYRNYEMMINPAYTGSNDSLNLLLVGAKAQWVNVDGSPKSQNIQYQNSIASNGIGVHLYHEKYGVTDITQFNLAYAYKIVLGDSKLSFGLQIGALTTSDGVVTNLNEVNDPAFAEKAPKLWGFSSGIGAYYYANSYYIGLSVPQLLTNDWDGVGADLKLKNSVAFNRMQCYLTGGYAFDVAPNFLLMPTGLIQLSGSSSFGYELMLTGAYNNVFRAGVGVATNAIRAEAGAFFGQGVSLSYRYEQAIGSTYSHLSTTHTLALAIIWGNRDGKKSGFLF